MEPRPDLRLSPSASGTMPEISPAVLAARETIAADREKLRKQHESGSPGVQVCAHFTDQLEGIVVDLFRDALAICPRSAERSGGGDGGECA